MPTSLQNLRKVNYTTIAKGKAKTGTKLKTTEALDEAIEEPARETLADGIARPSEEIEESNPGADRNNKCEPIKERGLAKQKEMNEDEEEQLYELLFQRRQQVQYLPHCVYRTRAKALLRVNYIEYLGGS